MTLRQFVLLVDRYTKSVKQEDRRAGGIIAAEYNRTRTSENDPMYEWWDFFTEWKEKPAAQTEDEMFNAMLLLTKGTEGQTE